MRRIMLGDWPRRLVFCPIIMIPPNSKISFRLIIGAE